MSTGGTAKQILTRPRTEATRALIRKQALARGKERSAEIDKRVRQAMATMEAEIAANGGIYPLNGGAVSAAEVARRAEVHPTTFFSSKQRALGDDVRAWVAATKLVRVTGRVAVRRSLSERIHDWQALYSGLLQSHRDTELQLQQTESDLMAANNEIATLRTEKAHLIERLMKAESKNVFPLRKPGN